MKRGRLLTSFRQRVRRTRGENPRVRTRILLSRPGAPQGDTTGPKSRGLVFPEGDIADPQMSNEATDGLAPSVFAIFRAQLARILALFHQRAKKDPRRETTGSDSRRAPEAWCSRTGTLQPQIPTRLFTLLSDTPQTTWCYSGRPHPIFHPSSFAVDDVPYSCADQYIMAKKTSLFQDHREVGLIMSSHSLTHVNASVEACATLIPVLGTGRSKTPCCLAPTLNSRRIQS